MGSRDYTFDMSDQDISADWTNEASQFIWDSPQPDPLSPTVHFKDLTSNTPGPPAAQADTVRPDALKKDGNLKSTQSSLQHTMSGPSSVSDDISSNSSSSASSAGRKRKVKSSYPHTHLDATNISMSPNGSLDPFGTAGDHAYNFLSSDPNLPAMGVGMDSLSLENAGMFSDRTESFSPEAAEAFHNKTMSPMTIQPSKTFFVGPSQENSPESTAIINSHNSSPAPNYSTVYSSFFGDGSSMSDDFSTNSAFHNMALLNKSNGAGNVVKTPPIIKSQAPPSTNRRVQIKNSKKWPCTLTVDPIPEKSRVETQIPIRLTLQNAPPGVTKIHLPPYTISKPKYQTKPTFEKSSDTLELSAMLVCTSALQKDKVQERTFQNAADDIIPAWNEEYQSATAPGSTQVDDNDEMRPLNGGPVAICPTCINRERKRAARKKTKKVEEEEEWAKDETKRVIVFNCPEIKDWCLPGTKEQPVKEGEGTPDTIFVNVPMRIACYCRHHGEKIGFQVIFTIKSHDGRLLAQTICHSIMITDDHKQPTAGASGLHLSKGSSQMPASGIFVPGSALPPTFSQQMPFRHSWSTNSLPMLQSYYASQRHPPTLQHDYSMDSQSQQSTATATPRNLSRAPSPSNEIGHSTKKRRSGGAMSRTKLPAGLTMTRMENMSPTSAANTRSAGPASAGPSQTQFAFNPSGNGGGFGQNMNSQQFSQVTPYSFRSGPSTPALSGPVPGSIFGPPGAENDPYQFYSAPTSQHASRAPSPSQNQNRNFGAMAYGDSHIPQQAALALASLPPGINLNKPPIIQRLIPSEGPQSGGVEVTVLGSGFCQGLEVMFGDIAANNTTFWGDTTLVCISPPSAFPGKVPVVFQHQHSSAPPVLQHVQGLLPAQVIYYDYYDDDQEQMEGLTMDILAQQPNLDPTQLNSGDLARNIFQGGPSSGSSAQRPSSHGRQVAVGIGKSEEQMMMECLELLDMCESPYRPRLDATTSTGMTLLSLAAARGMLRLVAGLLARGANPNVHDKGGFTALMRAAMGKHTLTVRLLTIKGADAALRSLKGYSALELAKSADIRAILSHADAEDSHGVHRRPGYLVRQHSELSMDDFSAATTSVCACKHDGEKAATAPVKNSPVESLDYSAVLQAVAALAAWRDLLASHFLSLQQNVAFLPNLLPLPALQFPTVVASKDCEQYPIVRRLSDILWTNPQIAAPPAYSEIFPLHDKQIDPSQVRCQPTPDGRQQSVNGLKSSTAETSHQHIEDERRMPFHVYLIFLCGLALSCYGRYAEVLPSERDLNHGEPILCVH